MFLFMVPETIQQSPNANLVNVYPIFSPQNFHLDVSNPFQSNLHPSHLRSSNQSCQPSTIQLQSPTRKWNVDGLMPHLAAHCSHFHFPTRHSGFSNPSTTVSVVWTPAGSDCNRTGRRLTSSSPCPCQSGSPLAFGILSARVTSCCSTWGLPVVITDRSAWRGWFHLRGSIRFGRKTAKSSTNENWASVWEEFSTRKHNGELSLSDDDVEQGKTFSLRLASMSSCSLKVLFGEVEWTERAFWVER